MKVETLSLSFFRKPCFKILWDNNRPGKKNNPSDQYSLMNSNSLPQKAEENHGSNVLPIMCASRVALVTSELKWKVEKNIVVCFVYLTLVGFIRQRCIKSIWNRYTENKVASDKRQRMPTNLPWLETIFLGILRCSCSQPKPVTLLKKHAELPEWWITKWLRSPEKV